MKRETVLMAVGGAATNGKPAYRERSMLTHKGLGIHSEYKGEYTITHIASGYELFRRRMKQKEARELVEKVAEYLDWKQELKDLMKNLPALKEARDKIRQDWFKVISV